MYTNTPVDRAQWKTPLPGIFMAVAQPPKPGPSAALSSTNDLGNATQHDARVPSSAPGRLPVCPRGNFACARLAERQQRTARAALHRAAVERRFGRSGPEVRVALPFHDGGRGSVSLSWALVSSLPSSLLAVYHLHDAPEFDLNEFGRHLLAQDRPQLGVEFASGEIGLIVMAVCPVL